MPDYIPIDDKVVKAIGRPRRTILNMIKAGTLKGTQLSARDFRIDTSSLPSSFFADNPELTPHTDTQIVSAQETSKVDSVTHTDETTKALQGVRNNIALIEAQTKEAELKIKLEEVQKLRELPNTIKQRDEQSLERDKLSKQREEFLNQREATLNGRESNIEQAQKDIVKKAQEADNYIKGINLEAEKIMAEAKKFDLDKRQEANSYYTSQVELGKTLDSEIAEKQAQLQEIRTEIPKKANELISTLKGWTNYADKHATIAQRQEHFRKASSVWNIKDALDTLIRKLGG